MTSFKSPAPPHTQFFISSRLKSMPNPSIMTPRCTGGALAVLWSDATMSSLSVRAPLFTSICGEIGSRNWPRHCLPRPLVWVSSTFSYTPLCFPARAALITAATDESRHVSKTRGAWLNTEWIVGGRASAHWQISGFGVNLPPAVHISSSKLIWTKLNQWITPYILVFHTFSKWQLRLLFFGPI